MAKFCLPIFVQFLKNLLMFNYVATTSNFFFNRSFIDKVGFFSNLRYVHDWDYLLRIAKDYPICIIPEVLLKYRVHPTNTIKENHSRMILEIYQDDSQIQRSSSLSNIKENKAI